MIKVENSVIQTVKLPGKTSNKLSFKLSENEIIMYDKEDKVLKKLNFVIGSQ